MSRLSISFKAPSAWFYAVDHWGISLKTGLYVTTYPDSERIFELIVLGIGVSIVWRAYP